MTRPTTTGLLSFANNAAWARLLAALALLAGTIVSAHRLDEYLQAARIDLQRDGVRIALDLTPGSAVADALIAAVDRDHDGVAAIVILGVGLRAAATRA